MRKFYPLLITLLLLVFGMPHQAAAQIYTIDTEYGDGAPVYIMSISPNGKYVSGYVQYGPAIVWTLEDGTKLINPEDGQSYGNAVSDNGIIAGQFLDPDVLLDYDWDEEGPFPILSAAYHKDDKWTGLGVVIEPVDDLSGSLAEGISADGTMVGGSMYLANWCLQPTIWTNGVAQALEFQQMGQGARLQGLSGDGRVAAGWQAPYGSRMPVVWVDGEMIPVTQDGVDVTGECNKVSPNGKYVALSLNGVGAIYDVDNDNLIVIQDEEGNSFSATAVSDDGIAVGYIGGFPWDPRIPYIFSEKLGMVQLNEYLAELGIEGAMDADLSTPMAISADGLRITGFTDLMGFMKGWVADLDHHLEGLYPPSNLSIEEVATSHLRIQWVTPKIDVNNTLGITNVLTGYNVYRNEEKIVTLGSNMNMFEEIGLPNGNYTYKVTAIWNGTDESRSSNKVSMNTAKVGLPFVEEFTSFSLNDNYWNVSTGSINRWGIDSYSGIPAPAICYYNAFGNYNEYLISPAIDASKAGELFLTYNIAISMAWDDNTTDIFRVELFNGESWETLKEYTPYLGESQPFIFEKFDITDKAAGKVIRIRFSGIGNESGENLIWSVDNIRVYEAKDELVKELPTRFTAHKMDDGTVRLNWADPSDYATLAYTTLNNIYDWIDWIGNEGKPLIAGIKYEPEDLLSYNGYTMTSFSAILTHVSDIAELPTYNFVIYEGSERIYEQAITSPEFNDIKEYVLDTPYYIETSYAQPIYIGIEVASADPTDMPIGLIYRGDPDENMVYPFEGRANLFSEDNGENWLNLMEESEDMIYGGVAIKANIVKDIFEPVTPTDRLLGFMLYEDGAPVLVNPWTGELLYTILYNYTVLNPTAGASCYQVVALYDTQESSDMVEFCLGDEVVSIGTIAGDKDLFTVYPNPVESTLNISGEFTGITLTNMNGATILKSAENKVNVGSLPSGVYILKIESAGNAPVVKKIIKQ